MGSNEFLGYISCALNEQNKKMKYEINRKKDVSGPHNQDVLSVLFGTLLGDASYLEKKMNKSRIHLQQESQNQEYLNWLHSFFASKGYCSSVKPKMSVRICSKTNKKNWLLKVRTYSFASLNWLIDCFYFEGVKSVPKQEQLTKYLTPLALAIWFCDCKESSGKGFKMSTNCFTKMDIERLCDFLYAHYGIFSKPNKNGFCKKKKRLYCLYIHSKSIDDFRNLIKPFMVNSMHYKLK
jgi:hypothetical protein